MVWSIIIGCSQYGIISSSACKAFISFLLHVLSSARGVFEGLNYFRKIGAREKGGGGGILRLKSKFQHRGGFHLLSCVCSPVWFGSR